MAFTVYYLDDEVGLCHVFREFLTSMDIDVKTFIDATEAIEICKHSAPDLFFIDYRLKDTTGDVVAKAVSKDIPKILVTGELIAKEQHLFVDVINKPFRLKNVASVIQKYRV
jgi:DNA-binding NtrC family response regulator